MRANTLAWILGLSIQPMSTALSFSLSQTLKCFASSSVLDKNAYAGYLVIASARLLWFRLHVASTFNRE